MITTGNSTPVPITDTFGNPVHSRTDHEPEPGSVVLTDGEWGTAWQRHFSDGRWYPTKGGPAKTWAYLCTRRNLVLVYAARRRPNPDNTLAHNFMQPDPDREIHGSVTGRINRAQPEPQWGKGEL